MVKFQKRHYEDIAKVIKYSKSFNLVYKKELVNSFCDMFIEDNKLFSRTRFIKACGL